MVEGYEKLDGRIKWRCVWGWDCGLALQVPGVQTVDYFCWDRGFVSSVSVHYPPPIETPYYIANKSFIHHFFHCAYSSPFQFFVWYVLSRSSCITPWMSTSPIQIFFDEILFLSRTSRQLAWLAKALTRNTLLGLTGRKLLIRIQIECSRLCFFDDVDGINHHWPCSIESVALTWWDAREAEI